MNKKLIAVALAALPVAAMADVTLYGTLNGGLEHTSTTDAASLSGVEDYTSIIGFKGSEDLGNGLKTIWQVESRVHLDGTANNVSSSKIGSGKDVSTDGLATRQTFVGLDAGELGTVRIGQLNSAIKDVQTIDQWNYGNGVNGMVVLTAVGNRIKNAVRYDSATFAGFNANLEYGFGENLDKSTNVTKSSDVIGLGLNYSIADFGFHYAYQHEANTGGANNSSVAAQAGSDAKSAHINYFAADYNANNLYVGLAYQTSTGYDWTDAFAGANAVANNLQARTAALSVAYTIGAFTPKFSYVKGWDVKEHNETVDNSGYKQYIVGVSYALSKRTTAELNYGRLTTGKNSSLAVAADKDTVISSVALSMAHSF